MPNEITVGGKTYPIHNSEGASVSRLPFSSDSRGKKKAYITSDFGCFDIETTSVCLSRDSKGRFAEGYGYMYIWQYYSEATGLVMGRTWKDFIKLLASIGKAVTGIIADNHQQARFIVYVHNLPFEFSFMADQIKAAGYSAVIFATKSRKPLTYFIKELNVEFRCSLKLTGRGLAKYLDDMKAAGYSKMIGDLDYRVNRTPKTKLTELELGYCAADVIGLYYALRLDMGVTHDSPATIPLTSTGYVRRDLREAIKGDKSYQYLVGRMAMPPKVYRIVKALARGGDTLGAASHLIGEVAYDIGSMDFVSSYPAQLLTEKYPMGRFEYEGAGKSIDKDFLHALQYDENRYFITQCIVTNVRLKNRLQPIPCISYSKTYFTDNMPLLFNGRVLQCKGRLGIALDMISYNLFIEQYTYDEIEFADTYSCEYDYLPETLTDFIRNYFVGKCELKMKLKTLEKEGKSRTEEYEQTELDYNLYKHKLNGIFGMFYTDPLHPISSYDDGKQDWLEEEERILTKEEGKLYFPDKPDSEIEEIVKRNTTELYKNQITAVGAYIWGVHTASLGRYKLDMMIKAAGFRNVYYSDTDSIKFKPTPQAMEGLSKLNEYLTNLAIERNAYCDVGGKRFLLGIAENETDRPEKLYREFVTLGAKKYCYRDSEGLHLTLSGVEKKQVKQLKDDIANFRRGFVFNPAGGIMLHYINKPIEEVKVVGDDGTEDTILLGNTIFCEERKITLGGIVDERFGEDFSIYEEILFSMPDEEC